MARGVEGGVDGGAKPSDSGSKLSPATIPIPCALISVGVPTVLRRHPFLGTVNFVRMGAVPWRAARPAGVGWRVNVGESGHICAEACDRINDVYLHGAGCPACAALRAGWAGRLLSSSAPLSVRMHMWSIG